MPKDYDVFIGDYNTARKFLLDMVLYGYYTQEDYDSKRNIRKRTLDNEISRSTFYIAEENHSVKKENKKDIRGISYDRYRDDENFLENSYKLRTVKTEDILTWIAILQTLYKDGKEGYDNGGTAPDILDKVEFQKFSTADDYGVEIPDDNSNGKAKKHFDRNLSALIEAGIIEEVNRDNSLEDGKAKGREKKIYRLADNLLDTIHDEMDRHFPKGMHGDEKTKRINDNLLALYYVADFGANYAAFRTPFFFLKETVERYLKNNEHLDSAVLEQKKSLFVYEYNFIHNVLNDIIINDLIEVTDANRSYNNGRLIPVRLDYRKRPFKSIWTKKDESPLEDVMEERSKHVRINKLYPFYILTEYRYGRQYVIGFDAGEESEGETLEPCSIRLDHILNVEILDDVEVEQKIYNKMVKAVEKWNCETYNVAASDKLENIDIDFYYKDTERYVRRNVESEVKSGRGTITDLPDETWSDGEICHHFLYSIEVPDSMEIVPWIRRFGWHAVVREENDIYKSLEMGWEEARERYATVSKDKESSV